MNEALHRNQLLSVSRRKFLCWRLSPRFAKELVRRGNEVSVFTQDTGNPSLPDEGIKVITFRWPGKETPVSFLRPYHPLDMWKILLLFKVGAKELVQHCLQAKVDLVLALWALPPGHWGMGVRRTCWGSFCSMSLGSDIWVYGRLPISKLMGPKNSQRIQLLLCRWVFSFKRDQRPQRPSLFFSSNDTNASQGRITETPFRSP